MDAPRSRRWILSKSNQRTMMNNKKQEILERFVDNISNLKINKFCDLLKNSQIKLSDDIFKIKRYLNLNTREEEYFLNILSNFSNESDILLLLDLLIKIKNIKNQIDENTYLVWSSPIKYHEKIDQTYSIFLKMINNANRSIIFVGYAMTDDENEEIFKALKKATKERNVKIKIIFDKATKAKKWGKWTKSPKKIIAKVWGDMEYFPEIYTYDNPESSLHAKFLVVDEQEILVTSANMTDRAMTRNLEMGIKHRGKIAKDASEMVDLLIKKKIITKVTYD